MVPDAECVKIVTEVLDALNLGNYLVKVRPAVPAAVHAEPRPCVTLPQSALTYICHRCLLPRAGQQQEAAGRHFRRLRRARGQLPHHLLRRRQARQGDVGERKTRFDSRVSKRS